MGIAALDDHLAHLPRCDGRATWQDLMPRGQSYSPKPQEKTSVTWKQEMEVKALLPVGQARVLF